MSTRSSFTGRSRDRKTSRRVRVEDVLSRWLITAGGLGTIVSVFTVALFLIWVAVPLFLPARIEEQRLVPPVEGRPAAALHFALDEYRTLAWALEADGRVVVFRLDTGEVVERRPLAEGPVATARATGVGSDALALGFADGSVRFGTLSFATSFLPEDDVPAQLRELPEGELATHRGGVVERTPEGQLRWQRLQVELGDPVPTGSDSPVVLLDHVPASTGLQAVALTADGRLWHLSVRERRNLMTGKVTAKARRVELPSLPAGRDQPVRLVLGGLGSAVFLAWADGTVVRYAAHDPAAAMLVQEVDVVTAPDARLTVLEPLLGRGTLVAGDSQGRLSAWFVTKPDDAPTSDGALLVEARELLPAGRPPVRAVASSARSRMIAVGDEAGGVSLLHVTSGRLMARTEAGAGPVSAVAVAPKDDGLGALGQGGAWSWTVDVRHPEAGLAALFAPVWYEGYPEPAHVWQSSSGTDDFEMKLGLYPLVFGTLKATLYSMLLGAPLALLAAIYTSEFLSRRVRGKVKSTIELMASLPSVVLGFLGALVVAPFVEDVVPAVIGSVACVPFTLLLGAHLWQLLPQHLALRFGGVRLALFLLALPLGIALGVAASPALEALLFAGSFKLWADGQVGTGTGGWVLLLLPLAGLAWSVVQTRWLRPLLRDAYSRLGRPQAAVLELLRFVVTAVIVVGAAWALSGALTAVGLDPRGSYVGTYVQRNALVVGFVMGFAIIPIIYTIAEDALSSVPEHLRAASLGTGATPWQTAFRIVVPTAMSGLFSALMVGLGRAVGETMIVLMAAGNTPVMDWNVFNGFRTLSANIAVELPEAVRNSTHYRTLFLAALVLFAMTFVVNTIAELVRQRFRKRAYQL